MEDIPEKMCKSVVQENNMIKYVSDWFVTAEMLEKCKDEEWLRSYKHCKAQKVKKSSCLWHGIQVVSLTGTSLKTK